MFDNQPSENQDHRCRWLLTLSLFLVSRLLLANANVPELAKKQKNKQNTDIT